MSDARVGHYMLALMIVSLAMIALIAAPETQTAILKFVGGI